MEMINTVLQSVEDTEVVEYKPYPLPSDFPIL